MPRLSDTMEVGTVVRWLKKEGEAVKRGEELVEIETDKAVMTFESPYSGTLLKILVPEGQTTELNAPIAVIGDPDESIDLDALLQGVQKPTASASDQPSASAPSAVADTPSPREDGGTPVGSVVMGAEAVASDSGSVKTEDQRIKASPLARRLAREHGLSLAEIQGSGPHGRIIKRDIERVLQQRVGITTVEVGGQEAWTDIPVTSLRATIARRLQASVQAAPHFYLTIDVHADRLLAFHEKVRELYPDDKISLNDILMKLIAEAVARHPEVNAQWMDRAIRRFHHVHLGFAVAIEEGLVVPVIRFANLLNLRQLARVAHDLIERARQRTLKPEEMQGSTFTVSNLGMFGIDSFTAVINPPESAILAIGRVRQEVEFQEDGSVRPVRKMRITMSCDHRVIDGAMGARFLQTLQRFLEEPALVLV